MNRLLLAAGAIILSLGLNPTLVHAGVFPECDTEGKCDSACTDLCPACGTDPTDTDCIQCAQAACDACRACGQEALNSAPPSGTPPTCQEECARNNSDAGDLNRCLSICTAPPAPSPSSGGSAGATVPRTLQNPLGTSDLRLIIGNIVKSLLSLSGAAGLLMFVWGGFQFLTAGGDPKKVEKGRSTLVWATIGLVVIFSAYTLLDTLIKALSGSIF